MPGPSVVESVQVRIDVHFFVSPIVYDFDDYGAGVPSVYHHVPRVAVETVGPVVVTLERKCPNQDHIVSTKGLLL